MSRSALVAIAVLAAGILPRPAEAQPAAPPAEEAPPPAKPADLRAQVASIRKDLDQLKSAAAESQTVAGSVQQLSGRVVALEQQIDRLGRQRASGPDVAVSLDRLSAQTAALERDVEALRTQVAGVEQPAAGPGGGATYKQGFEWTTADGAYSIKISGFVQPRYETSLAEGGDTVNRATFRLRRGRLTLAGQAGRDELTYKLQIETVSAEAPALDYFLDYELAPELAIRAGQDKLYFTRSWWTGDSSGDLIERPAAVEGLRYERDVGVWIHGEFLDGRLSYHAGISNGSGANTRNDNIDIVALARVDASLLGASFQPMMGNLKRDPELRVVAGAGVVHDLVAVPGSVAGVGFGNRDVDADGDPDNVRVWSSSVDAAVRWNGLELVAEGIWRHEAWGVVLEHSDNQTVAELIDPDSKGRRNYLAGYVHASYPLVPEKLQVAARAGHSRVALLGVGGQTVDAVPPGDRLIELNGQLRVIFTPNLTLTGSYTSFNYNTKSGPEQPNDVEHLFIAQGQLNF